MNWYYGIYASYIVKIMINIYATVSRIAIGTKR